MPSKLMLAPNPRRSMMIDRVVVVERSADNSRATVLSVDALQNDEWAKRQFARYFRGNALWNLAALLIIVGGIAASFLWRWWMFIPALLIAGRIGYQGRVSGASVGERILTENPWARDRFVESGLIWEMPVKDLVVA